jgi:hypothetical protein
MLPELLYVCQWRIFLVDVGVGAGGVAVGVGAGDGVDDAGETETESRIRQHSRDTWITRPKQIDIPWNS